MTLARTEVVPGYQQELADFVELLRSLDADEWERPTRCEGWRVADAAAHVNGTLVDIVNGKLDSLTAPETLERHVEERRGRSAGELADELDLLLCMTVNPGWGGQPFIEHSIAKVERLRALLPPQVPIEVDGGIDAETARRCAAAGASVFVAGSAVFGGGDPGNAYSEIERSVNG